MTQTRINFYYQNDFQLENQGRYALWIEKVILSEGRKLEELSYIFCDDNYLLEMNRQYLRHDTYTDILTFDLSEGSELEGEIYISTQRVEENGRYFDVSFEEELRRVIVHGVLHLCGYADKTKEESALMRRKEEEKMQLFHVEQ